MAGHSGALTVYGSGGDGGGGGGGGGAGAGALVPHKPVITGLPVRSRGAQRGVRAWHDSA